MRVSVLLTFLFILTTCLCKTSVWAESLSVSGGQSNEAISDDKDPDMDTINEDEELEPIEDESETAFVKDPIQSYNRAIFAFNDKAYYYVFKPVYKGYNAVLPEKARLSVQKFFSNIKMPIRLVNCLFQGKFKGAGIEASRFIINSTAGIAGFFDPAKSKFHLEAQDEDTGQTLGKYRIGPEYFVMWPFLGPSTLHDTMGYVGDVALNPLTLISFFVGPLVNAGVNTYDSINEISLGAGVAYENITQPAIDPYIALKDAYLQNRIKKIKE
jgi:phospholipid-binding lipoprotein MlaA